MNPKFNLFRQMFLALGMMLVLLQGIAASAQDNARTIKGKIIDEENLPMPGVIPAALSVPAGEGVPDETAHHPL